MTRKPLRRRIIGLAAVALLGVSAVSCADQGEETTNATPQTDSDGFEITPGANQPAEVTGVDLHFLGMMIPHHEQAVEMSDIILAADDTSEASADLAQRIKVGQEEEIDTMADWVDQWDQDEVMAKHAQHIADGMLTPEQMDQLEALEGEEADTLFLQLMHSHHAGAIPMTKDQIDNGGYQPLVDLAQQMLDVQTAEMDEIEQILEARGEKTLTE